MPENTSLVLEGEESSPSNFQYLMLKFIACIEERAEDECASSETAFETLNQIERFFIIMSFKQLDMKN